VKPMQALVQRGSCGKIIAIPVLVGISIRSIYRRPLGESGQRHLGGSRAREVPLGEAPGDLGYIVIAADAVWAE
jgi:hypothetical protein